MEASSEEDGARHPSHAPGEEGTGIQLGMETQPGCFQMALCMRGRGKEEEEVMTVAKGTQARALHAGCPPTRTSCRASTWGLPSEIHKI
jgi:hypothetical protein